MRAKTRALTALALLASLTLVTAALREERGGSSDTAAGIASPSERERGPAAPSAVPHPDSPREAAGAPEPRAEPRADVAAAATAQPAEKVSGKVIDGAGAPIAGAEVVIAPFERLGERLVDPFAQGSAAGGVAHVTATDVDGRFELPLPSAAAVRLVARAAGYAPLARTLWPGEGGAGGPARSRLVVADLVLQPGGVLVGAVRTHAGAPVVDAIVRRLDPVNRAAAVAHKGVGGVVARTDAGGSFRVAELDPGPWRLLISAAAHPDAVFEGAKSGTLEEPLERTFVLDDGARITGRVVGGGPNLEAVGLGDLEVRAQPATPGAAPRTAALESSGSFLLDGLAPGFEYRVGCWRRGDDPSARPRSDTVLVPSGTTGVELRVVPPTTIEFRAIDAGTGAPVTEFEAFLVEDRYPDMVPSTALAGSDGRAQHTFPGGVAVFPVLRPDAARTYTLVVWGRTHAPREVPGLVCTPGLRLTLGDLALQAGGTLEVTVLDTEDGAPIAGALVSLSFPQAADTHALRAVVEHPRAPTWRRTTTDTNGRALLTARPPAGATLVVHHADFTRRPALPINEVELAPGRAEVRLARQERR